MTAPEFLSFEKISRFSNGVVITEKLDGTNAQIYIVNEEPAADATATVIHEGTTYAIYAGSRNRWITPADDNFGFAKWVKENSSEIVKLGLGRHYGEWWGSGIQRRYGLTEKRFSLFNCGRWAQQELPSMCHVVPQLFSGRLDNDTVDAVMAALKRDGSVAAPGFMNPEGIVLFHTASRTLYKKTFEHDNAGKWAVQS
jgi:hypothetical protein